MIATTSPYGRPAIDNLAGQITELKAGDALAPIIVVVRSNFVSVSTRRALAALPGGIANVTFITLRRLAEQIAAAHLAEAGRRPLSAPLISAAIRTVLVEAPGMFATVSDHPSTEQALAVAYRELRTAPEHSLDAVADCSERADDVIRIHRMVRERLSSSWYDEEDLLVTAAKTLTAGKARYATPVVIHLVPAFTAGEADLINALDAQAQVIVNVGLTGDLEADTATIEAHGVAGIRVSPSCTVDRPLSAEIVSTSDPDEEVRSAVRTITRWMYEGIRLGNIAVLYPAADPYLRLLHEQLTAAQIPVNGTPVRRVGDMSYGRTLKALIELPDRDFHRRDVLGLLAGGSIFDSEHEAESVSWERISRAAGIVHGEDWSHRLPRWAQSLRLKADNDEADGEESRAAYGRADADRADRLADFVAQLRDTLTIPAADLSWAGHVEWFKSVANKYLGDDQVRGGWPEAEQWAAHRIEEALDRLAGLDALDGPPPSTNVFRRAFNSELDVTLPRSGQSVAGVLVTRISAAAGMAFERVLILGMSEGRFPARRLEDFLLTDDERAAADGHLRQRTKRVRDDLRDLLAVVAGADRAVLSYPRGDLRRSTEQPASRWLLDDASRLANVQHMTSGALRQYAEQSWLTHIPSFAGGLAGAPMHATAQELRLSAIAQRRPDHPLLVGDNRVQAARDLLRARRSDSFTRFDGNLSDVSDHLGLPDLLSPTALETWAKCPRSYLFNHVLRVRRIEEPEKRFDIDPLTRGALIHAILEDFVKDAITSGHPFGCWSTSDHQRLQQIAAKHLSDAEQQGRTGRAMLWRSERMRIANELDRLLDADTQRFADGLRPVAAELTFNDLEIELPDGQAIRMRGSIDRIDQKDDGSIEVLDYKTGGAGTYRDLSEDDPHQGGRRLQLYVYGRAALDQYPEATTVRSLYWFTRTNDFHGYAITDGVEQQVLEALNGIITGITNGVFPAHPTGQLSYGWVDCWYCTPDGGSDQDVRRDWERKKKNPALSTYLALIESGVADGAE